ncbi:DUF5798 family protein [Haloarchaeobius sp. TZWSO28]|uniref:DUF5798 family protein n=1 Tax=unclassified Haloarchaeobius TaxID=2614452 RepID=UPI003EBC8907
MGLGSAGKMLQTLQTVSERAEQLYAQLKDVRERLTQIENDVDATTKTVGELETELTEHRVILEALAEKEGIDVGELLADELITEAEAPAEKVAEAETSAEDIPVEEESAPQDEGTTSSAGTSE